MRSSSQKRVRAETRERIFAAAAEFGYIPNLIAGNLASGRSRVIAAIVPSLRNSNFARMIQGLTDHLEHRGYELLLAVADTPERQLAAVTTFLGRRVDGLLLTGTEHSPEVRSLLEAARTTGIRASSSSDPTSGLGSGSCLP